MNVAQPVATNGSKFRYFYEKRGVVFFQRRGWDTIRLNSAMGTPEFLAEREEILSRPAKSPEMKHGEFEDQNGNCFYKSMEAGAKKRAKKNGRDHGLPDGWMREQFARQNGRCAVSGVEFKKTRFKRSPLAPSIDRIDSSKGYSTENCRLVTYIVNCAKNQFSDAEFYEMCLASVRHKLGI